MKYSLFFLCLIWTISASAMRVRLIDDGSKVHLYEILLPSFGDGIRVSAFSSTHGVCKALGFQHGNGKFDFKASVTNLMVVVDDRMQFLPMPRIVSKQSGKVVNRIECFGPQTSRKLETSLLTGPVHPRDRLPFHKDSNTDGVCLALGFGGGVKGAYSVGTLYRGNLHVVDGMGKTNHYVAATDLTHSGHEISNIVCRK